MGVFLATISALEPFTERPQENPEGIFLETFLGKERRGRTRVRYG
jgi:hypothetical protein